jgi:pimeloyl-ACP methyl ester carboxylesterase
MMPGMAANPSIFEFITLDANIFETHWMHWILPLKNESLTDYAKRIVKQINHDNPVLIGVSFGGVLAQEISKLITLRKLIIVSSVKQTSEIPKHMQFAKETGIYKYIPFGLLNYLDQIEKLPVGDLIRKRIKLYKQFLSVNDKDYLDWAVEKMVCWEQHKPIKNLIHIHGDQDRVFPIKNIENCITVQGGTHIMIINRFRWFNEHLPKLILK